MLKQKKGQLKQSRNILRELIKEVTKTVGIKHPDTAKMYGNLSLLEAELGNFSEAKILAEKAIGI